MLRFDSAVNEIPEEAIEIEHILWARLVKETDGVWRRTGETVSKEPLPALSVEALRANERDWRDMQMESTEWLVSRHRDEQAMQLETTLTAEQFTEMLTYRQELRDWPSAAEFPDDQARPVPPAWLLEQAR
ncbi:phage tail protein [Pseudomonas taiwanensis]|nr:phage tail protein [Pseudomonas taiwanensis]